jgi:hypothetical protein
MDDLSRIGKDTDRDETGRPEERAIDGRREASGP